MARVRVQTEDFDVGRELDALTRGRKDVGGLASFVGLVRDANDGEAIRGMTLEHYPGMTEKALEDICAQAAAKWKVLDIVVIHRVGPLVPGDRIVMVGVASRSGSAKTRPRARAGSRLAPPTTPPRSAGSS